jgi:hypothetical protein
MMQKNLKKALLIDRLLENNDITREEAEILREENEMFNPIVPYIPEPEPLNNNDWISRELNQRMNIAENCPCNPKNGGSGMCGCTLASPVIYS